LTLDEILATVSPLAEFLQARGSETAGAATLTDRATLRRAAQDLVCSGVLTSNSTGASTVWVVGPQQHLVAAMYRNSAIHTLVQRAIVELVLLGGEDATIEEPYDARGDALRLRDLLKFEFFFAPRQQFLDELRVELRLIDPEIRFAPGAHLTDEQAKSYLASMKWVLAHLVLRPFIDAYSIVAHQLLDLGDAGVLDQDRFIAQCLSIGHQWALRRRIASEESNSAEMFRTALRLAANRELLDEGAQDLAVRRREFVDEIQDVQRKLDEVASLRRS
ncbi:MAG: glycerol-3-phosphate O-acyltransferase, partial [Actinomycetota bacterium]|nr:glycerol-3-phosphate O-acyltransferase [Actinomycetota bacterium]